MLERVTLTKVYTNDKDKEGKEFKTKDGKKFWKVAIQTLEHGDTWMSNLFFDEAKLPEWNEGDEVTIVIEEKNGFKNFRIPSKYDTLEAMIMELQRRVKALETPAKVGNTNVDYPQDEGYTEEEINPDDVPF